MRPALLTLTAFLRRLTNHWRDGGQGAASADEIAFHVDMLTRDNIASGMTPEQARDAAIRRFGNRTRVAEESRDAWGFHPLERLLQDLRYAARGLYHDPWFTITVILTLAVGIGATVATFGVVNGVLLRPLPVQDQRHLLVLATGHRSGPHASVGVALNFGELRDFAARSRALSAVAGVPPVVGSVPPFTAYDGDRTISLATMEVTGNFFQVLGVRAARGRLLNADDDARGAAPVVVLSDAAWHREFGGRPDIVGRAILLGTKAFTVVGVAPPGFTFPGASDAWMSLATIMRLYGHEPGPDDGWFDIIARLHPGANASQAQREFTDFLQELKLPAGPDSAARRGIVTSYSELTTGDIRQPLVILSVAVALLLVITCTNVAGLVLGRGLARAGEMAVRSALGASRGRIIAQLMIENAFLGAMGGAAGVLVAWFALRITVALAPSGLERFDQIRFDGSALVFALLLTIGVILAFGLIPARAAASARLDAQLRRSSRAVGSRSIAVRTRGALVVVQLALALVVLVGGGLLVRSLARLQNVSFGFRADHLLFVIIYESKGSGDDQSAAEARHAMVMNELAERLPSVPGIRAATVTWIIPFSVVEGANGFTEHYDLEGQSIDEGMQSPIAGEDVASDNYFTTLGIPLIRGRALSDADNASSPRVAVVSQSFASLAWPGENPLGKRLRAVNPGGGVGAWRTVVGIAKDTRYRDVTAAQPMIYIPVRQSGPGAVMAVRTSVRPLDV
ncbi:MAG: ABC transporter permease, partial [Gemmatimonadaceae bacterium]